MSWSLFKLWSLSSPSIFDNIEIISRTRGSMCDVIKEKCFRFPIIWHFPLTPLARPHPSLLLLTLSARVIKIPQSPFLRAPQLRFFFHLYFEPFYSTMRFRILNYLFISNAYTVWNTTRISHQQYKWNFVLITFFWR